MEQPKKSYDEVSPITNNLCVFVDADDATGLISKICMESGFVTNSYLIKDSKTVEQLKDSLPLVAYNSRIVDRFNQVWIPMMQSTELSSIYPTVNEKDPDDFIWQVTPLKKIDENTEVDTVDNTKDNFFIDFENSKNFSRDSFPEAFDYFIKMSEL